VVLTGTGGAAYALGRDSSPPSPSPTARVAEVTDAVATAADRAVAELTDAVAEGPGIGRRRAGCVARTLVAVEGLGRLVGAGVVAADGRFLDPDLRERPAVRRSLTLAVRGCP
jgi:hypothetical protein